MSSFKLYLLRLLSGFISNSAFLISHFDNLLLDIGANSYFTLLKAHARLESEGR